MKVWNSSWFSYLPGYYAGISPLGVPSVADSVDAIEGARKTTTLPVVGIRSGNFLLSASHARYESDFRSAHSSVLSPTGQNILTSRSDHLSRKESDLTAGYSLTPNIALTVGYKHASEERDTSLGITGTATTRSFEAKVKGLVFGVTANFPVRGGLGFYGLAGYGPARLETLLPGQNAAITSNGRYLISEIGLTYSLVITDAFVKGANVGLGYRSQTVKTDGVGPGFLDQRDYRDVKDGVTLSLTVAL
ncbi:hypothetical protein CR105_25385 [Massilia eurypsychrophila]|uniref:Outer membrane protein beta-barrel domain-containing protein n=1 Tax=Massilia eurypsychrophila TaxID=1485217 RepID=A0A2G8T815_9BURK|nr:hypothetical protein CR105_25385 [Massilia eurypsychrophila]